MDAANTSPTPGPAGPARTLQVGPEPVRVVIEQSRGSRIAKRLLWAVLGISLLVNLSLFAAFSEYFQTDANVTEKYFSLEKLAANKVAIITVEGTILGHEGFVKNQIDKVREDEKVKAVVLRVDSPGGTITGSDYLYHHLRKLRADRQIPIVVSMGSLAASGGYYVAMAAGDGEKLLYAEPTTWTGSVGVIIPHYDLTGLLDKLNVSDDSIVSHPLKQMGSITRKLEEPMRERERAILKQLVDDSFASFKQIVLDNRPELRKNEKWQEEVFTGRIFTAGEAKQVGLVDELGFIEDAIDRAIVLAGLDKKEVRVVKYKKPASLLDDTILGSSSVPRGSVDLRGLLDLAAPRAFYLCTWLPGLNLDSAR